jgi:hypothetical protein
MGVKFQLQIQCDNDAFCHTGSTLDRSEEVARILREAARLIETNVIHTKLSDANGNVVGACGYTFTTRG